MTCCLNTKDSLEWRGHAVYVPYTTRLNTMTSSEDRRQSTLESIKVVVVMLELAAVVPAAVSLFGKVYRVE